MNFPQWFVQMSYGATLFALIMGIISFFNGRMTRKVVTVLIRETRKETTELITETRKETAGLIKGMDKSTKEILERISDTQDRQSIILERIEARL